jgi:ketosteroid isomerase-like protein
MTRWILLPLILVIGYLPLAAQTAANEQTFRDLDRKWFDAFFRGDGASLEKLETPDLMIGQPDGTFYSKTAPRAAKMPAQTGRTREVSEFRVRLAGDTAIATGMAVDRLGSDSERTRFTEVWRRINNEWRVWSFQSTEVAGK